MVCYQLYAVVYLLFINYMILYEDKVRELWSSGKRITLNKTSYRVGRMSYGDYFLEPGIETGETKPFNHNTLWLQKVTEKGHKPYYSVSHCLA